VSYNKAKEFVAEIMAMLTPSVLQKWGHDPQLKKEAEAAICYTEKAMVEIIKHLFAKRLEKATDSAHDYAPFLGSVGAQKLLDIIAGLRHPNLDSVRPSLKWASGRAYYNAGDLATANERLLLARRLARSQNQESLAARMAIDMGSWAYENRDYKTSKNWYEKAKSEAIAAKDVEVEALALHNMATQKLDVDPSAAHKLLKKALELKEAAGSSEESKAATWTNIGILYANAGDHQKAYDIFKKVVETYEAARENSDLPRGFLNLANSNAELGRFGEAKRLYQKGLRLAERWQDLDTQLLLHQGYATSAFKHGEFSIAAAEFYSLHQIRAALGEDHRAAIALHDLSLSLARKGNKKEARKVINRALERFETLNDKDWYRRCLLLIASEIEDRPSDKRIEILKKAADLVGGKDLNLKLAASRSLWHELISRGMFKDATQRLNKEKLLLKKDPAQLKARLHHAGIYLLEKGRKKEALRLLKYVEHLIKDKRASENAIVRQDLSIALAENGEFGKACDLLDSNIRLARKRKDRVMLAVSLGNLGEIKNRAGLHAESLSPLKEAVRLSRELHDIEGEVMWLNNLSIALSDIGRDSESEKMLKIALGIAENASVLPEVARIRGSMGNLAIKNGRLEDARLHYTAAIEVAEKAGLNDFAISMRYNRAISHYNSKNIKAALSDAKTVVERAYKLGLYDLTRDAALKGAYWAIESKRPSAAGEFTAIELLSNFMLEKYHLDFLVGLLVIAREKLSHKRYQQYYKALKRQLLHSDKTGVVWNKIEQIEKTLNTPDS
jgi:tetratricopeptide (TPR) repeat protein